MQQSLMLLQMTPTPCYDIGLWSDHNYDKAALSDTLDTMLIHTSTCKLLPHDVTITSPPYITAGHSRTMLQS